MQKNKLKNMIVLNNFASNVVEEAFVVLKPNVKIAESEKRESKMKTETILKEAEMLIKEYVNELQRKTETTKKERRLEKKCKILQAWNIFLIILFISFVIISL